MNRVSLGPWARRAMVYEWKMGVDPKLVRRERPDLVIHEIWAGSLYGSRWGSRTSRLWHTPSRPWLAPR